MNVVCGIQARMGSSRLPGKVMMDLCGTPLIGHIIKRLKKCNKINTIVLCTSTTKENKVLLNYCTSQNIETIQGDEFDVLSRYWLLIEKYMPETVVRICADNPILDPIEIDRVIEFHCQQQADYSFNNIPYMDNGYPDGIGAEVANAQKIMSLKNKNLNASHREHVTQYFWDNKEEFIFKYLRAPKDIFGSKLKLDIDYLEDYQKINDIFKTHYPKNNFFGIRDLI
ncbi:MAG: hypothetical protein HQK49_18575 [Oligoflexia bacterium]|nr:hypothetical protein [Oligoflexia bacterium]